MEGRRVSRRKPRRNPLYVLFMGLLALSLVLALSETLADSEVLADAEVLAGSEALVLAGSDTDVLDGAVEAGALEEEESVPQATRDSAISRAKVSAKNFFMFDLLICYDFLRFTRGERFLYLFKNIGK